VGYKEIFQTQSVCNSDHFSGMVRWSSWEMFSTDRCHCFLSSTQLLDSVPLFGVTKSYFIINIREHNALENVLIMHVTCNINCPLLTTILNEFREHSFL
jgi:hypothetical protein